MCSILELACMQTNDIESLKQKILGKNTDYRRLRSSAFTLLSYLRNQPQKGGDIFVQEYLKMDIIWHIAEIAFLNYLKELKNVDILWKKKFCILK